MQGNFDKINNLQLLCSQRMCTIKDVKAEALLSICHSFASDYIQIKKQPGYQENLENYVLIEEDEKIIDELMNTFYKYLSIKILTYPKMIEYINNANRNTQSFTRAKLAEPINFFYKELTDSFVDRLIYVSNSTEKQTYVPSMLAIFLIIDFKEKASYLFEKYEFIKNQDFNKLSEIYYKLHKKLKAEQNISMTTPITEQTIIRKMSNVSLFMVEKLLSSDYKKSLKKVKKKIKK